MLAQTDDDNRPVRRAADLVEIFSSAEKAPAAFRIGAESEKFGVNTETGAPLAYDGAFSVTRLFQWLIERGWEPERESAAGPVIALRRGTQSITLEPGSQFELSGSPLTDLHGVRAEFDAHFEELAPIAKEMNLTWLGVGFQPLASQADLSWVPKQRYAIMREYLPPLGDAAHDMMRRTATVQVNLDYSSEADAMRKLVVGLKLSPLVHALSANAPFIERRVAGKKSVRGDVWLHMDPSRSGLVARVLRAREPRYSDYVEWALDAGMFLIKRGSETLANTGQPFRDYLESGYRSERATFGDWKLHLNTLFPEVRLKNTIEARCADSQKLALSTAVPALWVGLFYDDTALARAEDLAREIDLDALFASRSALVTRGLDASIGATPVRPLAERLLQIAADGLDRRALLDSNGKTERVHLDPLIALTSRGRTPADELLDGLTGYGPFNVGELLRRTASLR